MATVMRRSAWLLPIAIVAAWGGGPSASPPPIRLNALAVTTPGVTAAASVDASNALVPTATAIASAVSTATATRTAAPGSTPVPVRTPAPTPKPTPKPKTAPSGNPASPITTSIAALDPSLATYLAGFGSRVGVEAYDYTRGVIYASNASRQYLVASSIKIEIMAAFLSKLEGLRREPSSYELSQLTTMIENSNNDAAAYLWAQIGEDTGMTAYMRKIGVSGLTASPTWRGWGWSTITPPAQVRVLTLLFTHRLLNSAHTTLALNLMEHIESDQREGVGDTAPAGATVAMKVGWVPGPDGMWVMNSSGIVTTTGGRTYVVSVYTIDDTSLSQGWNIADHVCAAVSAKLGH